MEEVVASGAEIQVPGWHRMLDCLEYAEEGRVPPGEKPERLGPKGQGQRAGWRAGFSSRRSHGSCARGSEHASCDLPAHEERALAVQKKVSRV